MPTGSCNQRHAVRKRYRPHGQAEPFLTKKEFWIFMKLLMPAILNCFGGWFIFELQVTLINVYCWYQRSCVRRLSSFVLI